jgi:hypothetical protein
MKYLLQIPGDTNTYQGQHNSEPHRKAKTATHGACALLTLVQHASLPPFEDASLWSLRIILIGDRRQSISLRRAFQPVKSISYL